MKSSFNLNINKKIIIYSSVFGILMLSLLILVIYPLYSEITKLNGELYDQRVQLAIYQKQRLNLDETRKEYNNIKSDIDNITSVLLKRDDLLEFIDLLDTTASQSGVTQKVNLYNLDDTANSDDLQMSISLNGSWNNLNKYLFSVESLEYYLILDNVSLIKNDDGNLDMDFTLAVYLE